MKKMRTARGFTYYAFKDQYGADCTLQMSSLATKACVWLGCEPNRMHLSQGDAKRVVKLLNKFIETGEL